MTSIAGSVETPDGRIWIPPTGKAYWVTGPKCRPYGAGPDLTTWEHEMYLGFVPNDTVYGDTESKPVHWLYKCNLDLVKTQN